MPGKILKTITSILTEPESVWEKNATKILVLDSAKNTKKNSYIKFDIANNVCYFLNGESIYEQNVLYNRSSNDFFIITKVDDEIITEDILIGEFTSFVRCKKASIVKMIND